MCADIAQGGEDVPGAVARLAPLADLVAEIVNDGDAEEPVLARLRAAGGDGRVGVVDAPPRWEELAARFRSRPQARRR